jgi:hypothetical protein
MKSSLLALLTCATFLAIAAAAAASGSNASAAGRDGVQEELGASDDSAGGVSGPEDAQGNEGPEGDHDAPGAAGDIYASRVTDPSVSQKLPAGESGAPSADRDSGNARAPPAAASPQRTGPGA